MRPIIKIYNLGDSKYEVDIDVFHITREDAYNIMSTLCEIYHEENPPTTKRIKTLKNG